MDISVDRETIVKYLKQLPMSDRLDVIADVLKDSGQEAAQDSEKPLRSLLGLWEGISISAEDIDEARREMWGNFPRDDF